MRERRAFGADAFLDDLDEHFVAAAEDVLNRRLDARPHAEAAAAALRPPRRRPRPPSPSSAAVARRHRSSSPASTGSSSPIASRRASIGSLGIVAALAEVLRLDVADVQKAVAADAEIDERRLDARLEVDDPALVDVADVVVLAGPLDVQLFEQAVFDDRDPAFLRLRDVDQHFLFHVDLVVLIRLW